MTTAAISRAAIIGGLLLSGAATAASQTSWSLRSGYSWSDNLEVQSASGIERNRQNLSRQGIELGITAAHQAIDFDGGYSLSGAASYNRGIDGRDDNDTRNAAATMTRLLALSPSWLARLSLTARYYDSQPLPLTSYIGGAIAATFGRLGPGGSGIDIGLRVKHERHDADASERYTMTRQRLSLSYHFPRSDGGLGAALQATVGWNDADTDERDYRSAGLGASLRQIKIGNATLQTGIDWRRDRYDEPPPSMPMQPPDETGSHPMMATMPQPGTSEIREDTITYLWMQATHRLGRRWWLHLNLSGGRYDSTEATDSERFYSAAIVVARQF